MGIRSAIAIAQRVVREAFSRAARPALRQLEGISAMGGAGDIRGLNMTNFINMLRDEAGASAAEYALILAIVGAAIVIGSLALGEAIGGAMNDAADCIDGTNTSCR